MSDSSSAVVQTVGLTKVFKDFWGRNKVVAVKDLDLSIHPGEVFGLLGPNGSGKSTTIKMLLGLLFPTRGRIAVFGKAPTDVGIKSRIGYLPEESYLYQFLSGRETLDYYARLFQQPKRQRDHRIEKLLEMVGLQHQAGRSVGEYSKGMARRIGLAQALINDPDLLILDEPTTGLDPIGTRQIKNLIRELGNRGKTIILCSHLLADVEDVCDRVTIVYGGQQRAAGQINDLLAHQDQTQLTTGKLSESTIAEVGALISRLEKKDIVEVGTPFERLETFFLRIVEEARAANIQTSGSAGSADQLPDFLRSEDSGRAVIESLVAESARPMAPVKPVPVPELSPDRADQDVIEDLLGDKPKPPPPERHAEPEAPPVPPARRHVEADQSVIDALVKKDEDKGDG